MDVQKAGQVERNSVSVVARCCEYTPNDGTDERCKNEATLVVVFVDSAKRDPIYCCGLPGCLTVEDIYEASLAGNIARLFR